MQKQFSPVVQASGLIHRYGDTLALNEVSLDLPRGVVTGVIGLDAVGKSTFFGLVAWARKIQDGELRVVYVDLSDKTAPTANSSYIDYISQRLSRDLYPTLSVFENIALFARLFFQCRHERHVRIKDLLVIKRIFEIAGFSAL